jgi:hypothetical protein
MIRIAVLACGRIGGLRAAALFIERWREAFVVEIKASRSVAAGRAVNLSRGWLTCTSASDFTSRGNGCQPAVPGVRVSDPKPTAIPVDTARGGTVDIAVASAPNVIDYFTGRADTHLFVNGTI